MGRKGREQTENNGGKKNPNYCNVLVRILPAEEGPIYNSAAVLREGVGGNSAKTLASASEPQNYLFF